MSNKIFFTPGPTQLFHTYHDHLREAIRSDVTSISHRGKTFMRIFQETCEHLRNLLELPAGYHIYFTGSANEIWERIIQNLIVRNSHHFVNGAFARKFYEFALQYQKEPSILTSANGQPYETLSVSKETELISITLNETSNGFMFPVEDIAKVRNENPDALLAVDGVSAFPAIPLDFRLVDTAYFSVQKCFGMPAGLGVWIANERCLEKAKKLDSDGMITGSYHSLTTLHKHALKNQTPETPNVLSIYILGKIAEDMLRRGLSNLRNETVYKSTILYQALEDHQSISPFINDKKYRSKTVIVADTPGGGKSVIESFGRKGWIVGSGYGDQKSDQIRIANFPMHSKEVVEQLCDFLVHQ